MSDPDRFGLRTPLSVPPALLEQLRYEATAALRGVRQEEIEWVAPCVHPGLPSAARTVLAATTLSAKDRAEVILRLVDFYEQERIRRARFVEALEVLCNED